MWQLPARGTIASSAGLKISLRQLWHEQCEVVKQTLQVCVIWSEILLLDRSIISDRSLGLSSFASRCSALKP